MIAPLLNGSDAAETISPDDLQYVRDLGLVARDTPVRIANPIYREVIPRDLTWTTQEYLPHDPAWHLDTDGGLNLTGLLTAFQGFFREHSEHWIERFQYREAGPQLLLQAFLQRIVNSGGRVEREYGLGEDANRPAGRVAGRRAAGADPADGDRVQGAPRQPGAHHSRGTGADARLHGPLRSR